MNLRNRLPFFLAYAQKPRKPTFLEYIETDGNSYIDTGIVLSLNHKVSIRAMVTVDNPPTVMLLFGNYSDSAGAFTCNVGNNVGTISRFDGVTFTGKNLYKSDNKVHTYTVDKKGIIVDTDSILSWSSTPTDFQQSESFYLFCARGSTSRTANGTQISSSRVWENDILIQDLRPALDPSGVVCMYDTVTKKYFYNAGTGELKAGGRFVESIVFDGNSWIDTGYMPSSNTRVVGSAVFTQWNNGLANYVFGVFGDNSNFGFNAGSSRNFFNVPWETNAGVNDQTKGIVPEVNVEYNFDISKEGCYINDVEYLGASRFTATFQAQKTMFIGWSNGTSAKQMIGEVTLIRIFESSELVQDLRPYVDGDGVACFKDVVTDTLFYNKGTGTLTYTEYEPLEFIYLDGNQYIDTLLPHETCTIETAVKYEAGHSRRMLTGWSGAGSYWGMMPNSNLEVSGSGTTETDLTDYTVVNIALDNENLLFTVTADGITKTVSAVYADSTYTIGCTVPSSVNKVIGNVYYVKARNANGVLVRDMIPVKRSDGVFCMYDRVENKYYEPVNEQQND